MFDLCWLPAAPCSSSTMTGSLVSSGAGSRDCSGVTFSEFSPRPGGRGRLGHGFWSRRIEGQQGLNSPETLFTGVSIGSVEDLPTSPAVFTWHGSDAPGVTELVALDALEALPAQGGESCNRTMPAQAPDTVVAVGAGGLHVEPLGLGGDSRGEVRKVGSLTWKMWPLTLYSFLHLLAPRR